MFRLVLPALLFAVLPLSAQAGLPACFTGGTWQMNFGGEYEGRISFAPPLCRARLELNSSRNETLQTCRITEGEGELWLTCELVETTNWNWRPDSFHLKVAGDRMWGSNDDGMFRFDNVQMVRD
ncbi:hypothetical protein SAMN06297129_3359 [Pseudooceanicola antarcticus]|uniref:Protease inhibitor Inh n=1 Tax=Pseudooceanicola antarcticus TaxID=1247613 RepID=A0A285JAK5_9RHOB|nr:hypothetical protein [Pseudooceanicola antarcticus]PJE30830.1 hypothetical protein CVM39_05140 [Pseudooceanicola antarcticus]SNY57288.1 hypothetical protein SAMN06297129_3359 [Pseudooceanicola antarcticus]